MLSGLGLIVRNRKIIFLFFNRNICRGYSKNVSFSKALVLQIECFGKNYSSFLDFTRTYEWTSGIFVLWACCVYNLKDC